VFFHEINLETVDGVLIDIDNTLYSYAPPHQAALNACYRVFSQHISMDFDSFSKRYSHFRTEVTQRLLPQGACRSRFLAFQAMFESMDMPHAYTLALTCDAIYWTTFIDAMTLNPDALHFLETCLKLGIPVVAVSDMQAPIQVQKLIKLNLTHLIQFLVTSEEVGEEKPSAKMFEVALKKIKTTPSKAIMVGDHPEKDIEAAQKLGIRAYQVNG